MSERNPFDMFRELISIRSAEEALRADAEREAEIRRQAADADATRRLAELECPADLLAWGLNHGIPAFAEMTLCAGFIAGWRAFRTWSDAREAAAAMEARK